jgi:carbonic anhydrase
MSVFSSQSSWEAQCLSANQSPVNLVQTTAKPCDISCDITIDPGKVSQATVSISDEGLILAGNLGSLKFREKSYVCSMIQVNHPSHHTIEGVPGDGEIIAYCYQSTGELLCLSALFRANTEQNNSFKFFKQFIPYGLPTGDSPVNLKDWSLSSMVPAEAQYFTYAGSTVVPPCKSCEWVVFHNMITMDTDDFAFLLKTTGAGSRNLAQIGERNVFYSSRQSISGVIPNDGKMYLKLRPTGMSQLPSSSPVVSPITLKKLPEDPNKPVTTTGILQKMFFDTVDSQGGFIPTFELVVTLLLIIGGCIFGIRYAMTAPFNTEFVKPGSKWTRETLAYIWNFLLSIPSIIWNWTIGWFTWLTKPKTVDLGVLAPRTPSGN